VSERDQVSASRSRPAYLDEFERKLAAALAQQADAKKTRLVPVRSSDANLAVTSSPSLGEALTRSSPGRHAERPLNVGPPPSSETPERGTPNHEALTVSVRYAGAAIPVGAATEPLAGGGEAVGTTGGLSHGTDFECDEQPAPAPAGLADASSADYASRPARRAEEPIGVPAEMVETLTAELSQAISDAFPQGGGGSEEGIAAAEPVVREAARAIGAANLHGREAGKADATKRGSRGRRFKALALTATVAMAGAVFMCVGGILSPAGEVPRADGPSIHQNMTPDQVTAAERAPSAEALGPSAASRAGSDLLKERPDVNSAAVVATPTAPQAAETAAVDAIQPAGGHSSGTSPVSIVSTPDAATPATPPLVQSFGIKSVPTVSQPAPITNPSASAIFPTGESEGDVPQPTAKPTRNVRDVGTLKPSAPKREVPMKVVGKPSTRAMVTKNNATSPRVAVQAPSQPLPLGTPAMHDNTGKEPNAAQAVVESAATAATPAATLQPSGLY
jgi:hypothetical protein